MKMKEIRPRGSALLPLGSATAISVGLASYIIVKLLKTTYVVMVVNRFVFFDTVRYV